MAESFADNVVRQKSWKDVSRSSEEEEEDEEEEYKKRFFKSAENFRYGKASKLNMLAFRKKSKQLSDDYENPF